MDNTQIIDTMNAIEWFVDEIADEKRFSDPEALRVYCEGIISGMLYYACDKVVQRKAKKVES